MKRKHLRLQYALNCESSARPVRLTSGPLTFTSPTASKDGKRIFAVGNENRYEAVRYNSKSGVFTPFLPQVPTAYLLDFSRDGGWIAYVNYPDGTLWKCRRDGSERIQLTYPPIQVDLPRWSPDGKRITFTDLASARIFLVPADGGAPEEPALEVHDAYDSGWSPDGNSLVFVGSVASSPSALNILDLKTHRISKVAGSDDVFAPRWSPDGQKLAGVTGRALMVFDFRDQNWTTVATREVQYHTWSSNSEYLYFTSHLGNDWSVYRVRVADRKLERVVSLQGLQEAQDVAALFPWFGLAPDDSILILRDLGGQEIYALEWESP